MRTPRKSSSLKILVILSGTPRRQERSRVEGPLYFFIKDCRITGFSQEIPFASSFTVTLQSPSRPSPASPGPGEPQDSSLPALPPAYRLSLARAPLRLQDRPTRHQVSPAEISLIRSWS